MTCQQLTGKSLISHNWPYRPTASTILIQKITLGLHFKGKAQCDSDESARPLSSRLWRRRPTPGAASGFRILLSKSYHSKILGKAEIYLSLWKVYRDFYWIWAVSTRVALIHRLKLRVRHSGFLTSQFLSQTFQLGLPKLDQPKLDLLA